MNHTLEVSRTVTVTKIALCGRLRSGKDTAAHHLYIKYGFDKVAFGDALKRNAHEIFPWVSEFSKPRALYQSFGQLMREIDQDVWVKHVERKVGAIINVNKDYRDRIGIVLTDVRQPNEVEWCRKNGFSIVRIVADDAVRLKRAKIAGDVFSEEDLSHETEKHIASFDVDFEIINNGGKDELKEAVDKIMEQIKENDSDGDVG